MAAVGHIQTLCDSIVTHLQGTTWTDLPVASESVSWTWKETIDVKDLKDTVKLILSPASRERSNTSRATFEDVIRVEIVLILAGESANDEAEINRFLVALDDVMERLDKKSFSPAGFRSQTNEVLLERGQARGIATLRSVVVAEYVFDFVRS